ncbi:MAG: ABC transporter substrate-binding protein [Acidimicrobiia bacterium]|nr:ABC transporter substrate-binding protein [Acidimicrobiia bacterium]
MSIWKRLLALLFAFSLVAAACGGSDDEASDDGATSDDSASSDDSSSSDDDDSMEEDDGAPAEILTDYGVTEDTIRVGLIPDLSGRFAVLTTPLTEAQKVYFEKLNERGGIAGRMVEPVILDSGYEVPRTIEHYEALSQTNEEGVVMLGSVTGSPNNSAIARQAQDDDLVTVPLSWYSGWADPDFGGAHYEIGANYCIEAMNGVEFLKSKVEANGEEPKLAVLSYPGEYGQDGAAGAKLAADALGIELVFDGEGQVPPGQDQTGVISQLVGSGANMVWITSGAADLGAIFGGAVSQGFDAFWSGNSPSYSAQLLGGDLGPAMSEYYFHSTYNTLWDSDDTPGMTEMVEAMTEARPGDPIQDVFVVGWIQGMFVEAVLTQAAENGDMTRAGIIAAANEVEVDFKGLSPNQDWVGTPNEFIIRETYIYDIDASVLNPVSLSDYAALDDKTAASASGAIPIDGFAPFVGTAAEAFEFTEPCFVSAES